MPSSNEDLEVLESLAVAYGFDKSQELSAKLLGPECDIVRWWQVEIQSQVPEIGQHMRILPRQARDERP